MIPYYIGDVMQAISQHRKPSKTHNPGFSSTDLFLETFPSDPNDKSYKAALPMLRQTEALIRPMKKALQ